MDHDTMDDQQALVEWRRAIREESGAGPGDSGEGLRERKKRQTRQQISDVATGMFLERGFDNVRVAEVAAACQVSEKTVYNYFPTKESLLLDREEAMADDIRRALGPGAARMSPVEAAVQVLAAEVDMLVDHMRTDHPGSSFTLIRFIELIDSTPSLRAAQVAIMERLTQVAAQAMADRAGVNPADPEPQIAADALLGLWRIHFRAMRKFSTEGLPPTEMGRCVVAEVRRAARLIDTGLWSFGMAVQGSQGRHQLKVAADASNEARKQVLVAIKEAREAWRVLRSDMQERS